MGTCTSALRDDVTRAKKISKALRADLAALGLSCLADRKHASFARRFSDAPAWLQRHIQMPRDDVYDVAAQFLLFMFDDDRDGFLSEAELRACFSDIQRAAAALTPSSKSPALTASVDEQAEAVLELAADVLRFAARSGSASADRSSLAAWLRVNVLLTVALPRVTAHDDKSAATNDGGLSLATPTKPTVRLLAAQAADASGPSAASSQSLASPVGV